MSEKFHRAARDGFLDILRDGNKKDMNIPDEDGCTPTMLAAQLGNLDALRMTIMRGGDVNKMDLLGLTALHHAAKNGQMNCVTFLVNFGANVWLMDNEMHTALDMAALENREDIIKFLDEEQSIQERKNPKIVQKVKEKATKEAKRNAKLHERLHVKASKDTVKNRRRFDRKEPIDFDGFKPPTEQFSALANSTLRKQPQMPNSEFHVSVLDESGKRTVRSVGGKGTMLKSNAQVLYVANNEDIADNSSRPPLTNVFTDTSLNGRNWNKSSSEHNLSDDSSDENVESANNYTEKTPGLFSGRLFWDGSFLDRIDHMTTVDTSADGIMAGVNGDPTLNGDRHAHNRASIGTDSIGTSGSLNDEMRDVPDELSDDDEDESEYTPIVTFLEGCGLTHYTDLFTEGDVDIKALMLFSNLDFQDMGLPIGPRRKLMDAIQIRKNVLNGQAQMNDTRL